MKLTICLLAFASCLAAIPTMACTRNLASSKADAPKNELSLAREKAELVDQFVDSSGLSKPNARKLIQNFKDSTSGIMKKGDRISLVGFGSFTVSGRCVKSDTNEKNKKCTAVGSEGACFYMEKGDIVLEVSVPALDGDGENTIETSITLPTEIICSERCKSLFDGEKKPRKKCINRCEKSAKIAKKSDRDAGKDIQLQIFTDRLRTIRKLKNLSTHYSLRESSTSLSELEDLVNCVDGVDNDCNGVDNDCDGTMEQVVQISFTLGQFMKFADAVREPPVDGGNFPGRPFIKTFAPQLQEDPCLSAMLGSQLALAGERFTSECGRADHSKMNPERITWGGRRAAACEDEEEEKTKIIKKAVSGIPGIVDECKIQNQFAAAAPHFSKADGLVGFGAFSISHRAARTGRNPQTGKEIKIAAKNVVRFKAGSDLSDKVN